MGLPKTLGWSLAVLLLANVVLFGLTIKSAEDVSQAQLQRAITAANQPQQWSSEALVKGQAESTAAQLEQAVCQVLGPYKRALTAAKVLKRLEQAGADTELLTTKELRAREVVAADVVLPAAMYWIKAKQQPLLQGAKPEELVNAKLCD